MTSVKGTLNDGEVMTPQVETHWTQTLGIPRGYRTEECWCFRTLNRHQDVRWLESLVPWVHVLSIGKTKGASHGGDPQARYGVEQKKDNQRGNIKGQNHEP